MEKFIQFCKKIGVHENLLFESDDLGRYWNLFSKFEVTETSVAHRSI